MLITGFQAQETLGRKLIEKLPEVSVFGEPVRVRAEVSSLDELSGHADQSCWSGSRPWCGAYAGFSWFTASRSNPPL